MLPKPYRKNSGIGSKTPAFPGLTAVTQDFCAVIIFCTIVWEQPGARRKIVSFREWI
jgi:hypothetical protein